MKKIKENLEGRYENHIYPFLWMHGEDEQILREYMGKIEESGVQAVCLEARPHPDFMGDGWWRDMDILLDEAKARDMKLWILDDSHFPTGFANGAVKERYPQYRKRYLKLHQLDFAGPLKHAEALIKFAFTDKEDRLEGIFLAKKLGYEKIDASTLVDITAGIQGQRSVSFELPEGEWKVMVLVSTYTGGEPHTEDYLNPIVPEATDVLIREVYEPHYQHYREEFGKTILGFFSDEPRFGNIHGAYGSIGRCDMVLPWREDMTDLLAEEIGNCSAQELKQRLPLLFIDGGKKAGQIRYHYMNLVSRLYAEHFSQRIGDWCHERGISYIGHTIEDNNAHARLGYGAGHFFRAMKGQDMAGIDVVLHQLMPGMDHGYNKSMTQKGWDGEFFHYVLGKLGASLGHIEPQMKGRIMCEVFGAYGWAEGNRLMKWITDYMLVRGINEFVPHAFDPKEYPDTDCPPHFYAHGRNPQFREFQTLMVYMNRMSHLLSGGIHRAPVAVGYHGEAEWSGEYMLVQKPCACLARNQIDYDILPPDAIVEAKVEDGRLRVNHEEFEALVVPYAEALPAAYLKRLAGAAEEGLQIFILKKLPSGSSEGQDVAVYLKRLERSRNVTVLETEDLVQALRKAEIGEISCSSYEPYLRYYHYEHADGHIMMFANESPGQEVQTEVTVPLKGNWFQYDGFSNEIMRAGNGGILPLNLAPYESAVYYWEKDCGMENEMTCSGQNQKELKLISRTKIEGPFSVSFAKEEEYPVFSGEIRLTELVPLQQVEGKEDFTGVIRYEVPFQMDEKRDRVEILLDTVYEGARVSVNGSEAEIRICPPYRFDVTNYVQRGENILTAEVTTTLGRAQNDWLSQFILMEPTGITEQVIINQYEK